MILILFFLPRQELHGVTDVIKKQHCISSKVSTDYYRCRRRSWYRYRNSMTNAADLSSPALPPVLSEPGRSLNEATTAIER